MDVQELIEEGAWVSKQKRSSKNLRERYATWKMQCLSYLDEIKANRVMLSQFQLAFAKFEFHNDFSHVEDIVGYLKGLSQREKPQTGKKKRSKICNTNEVFIVHGHNNETKEAVARVLQLLGLEAIILNEKSNQGKTIIEKLEHYGDVGYAIILLTPCDLGKAKEEIELTPRARQNVIAELGYFIGRLGRDRVSIIHRGTTEIPSDFKGLGYISYDKESWKYDLAKELKSAGYKIDVNNLI